jgi:hypothetical protein
MRRLRKRKRPTPRFLNLRRKPVTRRQQQPDDAMAHAVIGRGSLTRSRRPDRPKTPPPREHLRASATYGMPRAIPIHCRPPSRPRPDCRTAARVKPRARACFRRASPACWIGANSPFLPFGPFNFDLRAPHRVVDDFYAWSLAPDDLPDHSRSFETTGRSLVTEACSFRKTERQPSGVNGQDCYYVRPHFRVRRVLRRRWTSRLLPRKRVDGGSRDCRSPER